MSDRAFFDTNVLVYLFDGSAPKKRGRAREVLEAEAESAVISTQVLQEFYVGVTRKLGKPLREAEAEEAVRNLSALTVVQVDTEMVLGSISSSRRHRVSLWDALIVEAARLGGCQRLLSEDLQHGREFDGLRIENPFR